MNTQTREFGQRPSASMAAGFIPFKHMPSRCGVYQIQNIITRELYVGGSTDICSRCEIHSNRLRLGEHNNPILTASYELHGPFAFQFGVIARLTPAFNINSLKTRPKWANLRCALNKCVSASIRGGDYLWLKEQAERRGITGIAMLTIVIDAWKTMPQYRREKSILCHREAV